MGRCCLAVLLVSALMMLSISHGFGRKMKADFGHGGNSFAAPEEVSREVVLLDYANTGPNMNSRSAFISAPPPSPTSPPLPPGEQE